MVIKVRVAHQSEIKEISVSSGQSEIRKPSVSLMQEAVTRTSNQKATKTSIRLSLAKKLGLKTYAKQQGGEKPKLELVLTNKKPIQKKTVQKSYGLKEERTFYRNESKYACTPDEQVYINQVRYYEQYINNNGYTKTSWG